MAKGVKSRGEVPRPAKMDEAVVFTRHYQCCQVIGPAQALPHSC